jgi:hypothetical protein
MQFAGGKHETILVIFFRGNMLLVGPSERLCISVPEENHDLFAKRYVPAGHSTYRIAGGCGAEDDATQ